MKTEIEAKFLDINIEQMRDKLKSAGATLKTPMRDMRRALIETDAMKKRNGFYRIRDEGDKITLTYKQFDENSLTGAKEREVEISDFDETLNILSEANLHYHTLQESRRETWQIDDVEIVIDEWPWINPYVEIEGSSENAVKQTAKKLGFNWEDAVFGSVDVIYNLVFPNMEVRGVIDLNEVRFGAAVPTEFGRGRDDPKS